VLRLRYLGVDGYGRYGTVMALLAIVQGVTDAGLSLTGSRELSIARTDAERRDVLSHLIGLRIILSAVGLLLAVGFAAAGYSQVMVEGTAIAGRRNPRAEHPELGAAAANRRAAELAPGAQRLPAPGGAGRLLRGVRDRERLVAVDLPGQFDRRVGHAR
jgi:hypothetical protein